MKTSHFQRKILVTSVLALGMMAFAMYPNRPTRHAESENTPSEATNQTPTEHEGDNASTSQAFSYSLGKAMLVGEEGAMGKEAKLSINGIDDDLPPLNIGMVNVTGEHSGFRMLPHGTRFNKDIAIVLPYDSLLIPAGYSPEDIRTYYYDETESTWLMVELDKIDVDNQCVVSKVNHFTDFINAIIKTPEVSETTAFVPTMMNDFECANPLSGIPVIAAPTANNMGSANFSYPINIPNGRAGMQPQLSVTYNNNGGSGWMGEGWDLSVSCISIDTRWGVPRFDNRKESEVYMLDGKQLVVRDTAGFMQPLPYQGEWADRYQSPKRFYMRVEGGFQKIMRYGNTPKSYYWEVTDKDGTVYYYGKPVDGDGDDNNVGTLKDLSGNVVRWYLTEMKDTDGNIVRYYYEHYRATSNTAERATYLRRINYTGHIHNNVVDDGVYDIWFYREQMNPACATNCRNGLVETNDQLLTKVLVKKDDVVLLSNYFYYKVGEFGKVLLEDICLSERNNNRSNVLYSFDYYGENDNIEIFGPETTIKANMHFDETNSFSWSIGGSTGAGTGFRFNKAVTAGIPFNYSEDESTGQSVLVDIDGDALPELLYQEKSGNNYLLKYKKLNQDGAEPAYYGAFPITGISSFLNEKTTSETVGAEGTLIELSAMYNHSWSQSRTSTYFCDVNADGYPDLVSNGSVYINRSPSDGGTGRRFVRSDRSANDYIFDTEIDESMFGDITIAETRYWEPNSTSWLINYDTITSDSLPLPDFDAVRMWEAPYSGFIKGNYSAILDTRLDDDRRNDVILDGVRVTMQLNDGQNGQNWGAVLNTGDSVFSPNIDELRVNRGDRLFFRIESMKHRKYDYVKWSPKIWYEGAYQQGADVALDPNGNNPLLFDAFDDFLINPGVKYHMPFQGKARVAGTVSITEPLNDTVRVKVHHNNAIISSNQYDAGNNPCEFRFSENINISANDSIWISLECLSNVKWSTIQCDASIIINEGVIDGETVRPEEGDTLIAFKHIVPVLTNYTNPVLPTTNQTGINSIGTFTVDMTGADTDGIYWLSIKKRNSAEPVLFQKRIEIVNGHSDSINANINMVATDTLCFELFTNKAFSNGDVLTATIRTGGSNISLGLYGQQESTKRIFGEMNRNWGQFAYQDKGYGHLIDTAKLHFVIDTSLFPIDSLSLYDSTFLDSPAYNLSKRSFATMNADYENQRQVGLAHLTFVSREGLGNFNPLVFDAALRNHDGNRDRSPWVAVVKESKTNSDNGNVFLYCISSSHSKVTKDYMDLNGDRYPDVLTDAQAQYSKPQGGLSEQRAGFRPYTGDAVSKTNSLGEGLNFCGSLPENNGFEPGTNGKTIKSVTPTGTSIGGNLNNSNVPSAWLDINGDGLPDIVTNNESFLNLGYSYARNPNHFALGNIQEGYSLSGSVGIGFNIVSTSFQGGIGLSSGMTMSKKLYVDINGDGLPDMITVSVPELTYDRIREFFRNGGKELTGIESLGTQMTIKFNTGRGFTSDVTVAGVMASQSVNYGQSANEALTVAWWVWLVKMFVSEQGNVADGKTWSKWQMEDMNGDGLPDLVCQTGKATPLKVRYNQTGKCNQLRSISSKMFGTTTLDYHLSEPSEAHPQRIWTMSDLKIDDGHHCDGVDVMHFTFEYDSAYYDRVERESYGFGVVKTHTMANGDTYRTQTDRFHTEDYLRKGLKYNETLTDYKGNTLLERSMEYVPLAINSGAQMANFSLNNVYPALANETTRYQSSPLIEKKTFQYISKYGNVTHYEHFAQGNNDRLVADIHYYRDESRYIVGTPDSIAVKDVQGHLLQARACDIDVPTGHVSTIRNHNSSTGQSDNAAQYDFLYDNCGNIVTCVGPTDANGQRMTLEYVYDDLFHCLPVTVANSLGDKSQATYDSRWGTPTTITDINGNVMSYEYDEMGRVSKIRGPLDPQYSIRHHYWFTEGNFATLDCVAKTEHYDCQHPDNPMVVSTRCDALGRVVQTKKEMEIDGVEMLQISGHVTYDAIGRPDSVYYPVTEALDLSDPYQWSTYYPNIDSQPPTVYAYDVLDRKVSVTLPDGATTRMSYGIENLNGQYVFRTLTTDANNVHNLTYTDYRGLTLRSVADSPDIAATTNFVYNTLGELVSVADPCDAITTYTYDMLGRCVSRNHPDAGTDNYVFDLAGNLTQEQKADGQSISYSYQFGRLTDVAFSANPENDIHYRYGSLGDGVNGAGHVVKMEDESGYARYSYDAMGNVSENCRTFALAAEDNAYTFIINTEYDTWGRTLSITYPDKERVSYAYDFGGNLKSVSSAKNGNDKSLVDSIRYDKFGDRTAVYFGNGTTQHYSYNPTSRRLGNLQGRTSANALMQDIIYEYDAVGNVTKTDNAAVAIGTLGGPYSCAYTYDHLNRLTATNCQQGNVGYTEQRTYLDDGRIATYDLNGTRRGYSYNATQPHTLSNIHTLPNRASDVLFSFAWDAKGNMTAQNSQGGSQRAMLWDERNRMQGMVDNAASGSAAHYVYDAQGERSFKLTGYSNHTGSGETSETYVSLDEPTLYASPYLTATATGYTKHYFAGTERLASAIGNGGLADIGQPIVDGDVLADKRRERDTLLRRVMSPYPLRINRNRLDTLYGLTRPDTTAELTYFFHPDHLGSASWITDLSGQPVQHLQYKPFGGDYIDQQVPGTDYSERYRFTGKERDAETGYDYFGARYYSSSLGIWLSVDPMSDKYPSLSPYVYCSDNPMKLVDPVGDTIRYANKTTQETVEKFINKRVNGAKNPSYSRQFARKFRRLNRSDKVFLFSQESYIKENTNGVVSLGENGVDYKVCFTLTGDRITSPDGGFSIYSNLFEEVYHAVDILKGKLNIKNPTAMDEARAWQFAATAPGSTYFHEIDGTRHYTLAETALTLSEGKLAKVLREGIDPVNIPRIDDYGKMFLLPYPGMKKPAYPELTPGKGYGKSFYKQLKVDSILKTTFSDTIIRKPEDLSFNKEGLVVWQKISYLPNKRFQHYEDVYSGRVFGPISLRTNDFPIGEKGRKELIFHNCFASLFILAKTCTYIESNNAGHNELYYAFHYHDMIFVDGYVENGLETGKWRFYYVDKLIIEAEFEDGQLNGTCMFFDLKGNLMKSTNFINNKNTDGLPNTQPVGQWSKRNYKKWEWIELKRFKEFE